MITIQIDHRGNTSYRIIYPKIDPNKPIERVVVTSEIDRHGVITYRFVRAEIL